MPDEDKFQLFKRHMSGNSSIEVVLKAHLLIEEELNRAMVERVPYPEYLTAEHLNITEMAFRRKAELCGALGFLGSHEVKALIALNNLRNDLAHRIDRTITKPDVIGIANCLDQELQKKLVMVKGSQVGALDYFRWTAEIVYLQVMIATRSQADEVPESIRRQARRDAIIKKAMEYGVVISQITSGLI